MLHVYGKDKPSLHGPSMKQHLLSLLDDSARTRVTFHGHCDRSDLFEALSRARAAVFPSYAEAFALAPLEAMGCGCPTIASSRGAGNELMQHGEHGLLVDPDDWPEIAAAMLRLLEDPQLARRLGQAGRQRVIDSFTIDQLCSQNEQFYEQCIQQFSGSP
jgi:glycosyltransferase involved in cell wall biosynthesis